MGKNVANILNARPDVQKIVTLSRSRIYQKNIHHIVCDRKIKNNLSDVISSFKPNVIIDMVAFDKKDGEDIVDLYNSGVLKFLKHYIVISSFFVYNYFDYSLFKELEVDPRELDAQNIDEYTLRKIEIESILYSSGLMKLTSILRLPFIFSSDDYSGRFQRLCQISRSQHIEVACNGYRYSMISKQLAAEGIDYLSSSAPKGIVDFANFGCMTSAELVDFLRKSVGWYGSKVERDALETPYLVSKNICLNTRKIPLIRSLSEDLLLEANKL
ncbi:hypothetical protein [Thalassospira lucentensis]|uniref:hypothetical protein n=1 Tax=Thalassospira lucentensis TaxID=168935 RepID=UPI00399D61CC